MDIKTDERIIAFQTQYLERLIKLCNPVLVQVFGSRARGDALRESDLDLLIVSDIFDAMHYPARAVFLYNELKIDLPVEYICLTVDEFQLRRSELGIVSEALKEGWPIYEEKNHLGI